VEKWVGRKGGKAAQPVSQQRSHHDLLAYFFFHICHIYASIIIVIYVNIIIVIYVNIIIVIYASIIIVIYVNIIIRSIFILLEKKIGEKGVGRKGGKAASASPNSKATTICWHIFSLFATTSVTFMRVWKGEKRERGKEREERGKEKEKRERKGEKDNEILFKKFSCHIYVSIIIAYIYLY
jgi:hypothetical protein